MVAGFLDNQAKAEIHLRIVTPLANCSINLAA
jgi:hypothetical protein